MNKINRKNSRVLLGNLDNEEIGFIEEQGAWQLLVENEAFFHDAKNEDLLLCLQEKVVNALQVFNGVQLSSAWNVTDNSRTYDVWVQVQTLYKWRGATA